MSLEQELDAAMESAYQRAGREVGYWGNYFLRSLRRNGGVATAKRMLRPVRAGATQAGLQALLDAGRPDLSLENLVLQPRFAPLFTSEELQEAARRLGSLPAFTQRRPVPAEANFPESLPEDREYVEGTVKRVLVSVSERDASARAACIRRHGTRCSVCDLSFEQRYGSIGKGFIHVHHRKPLGSIRSAYRLNPSKDLVPVCPNCHAMLHTSDPPLSVEELRQIVENRSGRSGTE